MLTGKDHSEKTIQRRHIAFFEPELRLQKREEDKLPLIVGHAIVFNRLSVPMWGMRERIERGAFAESMLNDDIRSLWNHNTDKVLARRQPGKESQTLRHWEDERGIAVEIDPAPTSYGRDAVISIERGDVTQMSFAFDVYEDSMHEEDGWTIRTIKRGKLYEYSPVTFAAYPDTDVNVRELMRAAGMEPHAWTSFIRAIKGADLSETDVSLVRSTIQMLEATLPELQGRSGEEDSESQGGSEAIQQAIKRRQREIEMLQLQLDT